MSFRIDGGDFDSAGAASRKLKEQLAKVGVGPAAMRRALIASYEAEMNVVIHARTGTLWARLDGEKLDIEVADEGPGIPDVELALREGWSTASPKAREMGFGAGMGLPNIRRSSDLFEIETRVGRGTRIRSTIMLNGADRDALRMDQDSLRPALSIQAWRCRRCMRCVFACPMNALRVRADGPSLLEALCIECTACIGACEDNVYGIRDQGEGAAEEVGPAGVGTLARASAGAIADAVLVLPRGFLAGFPVGRSPHRVLSALREIGFAEVRLVEEWAGALLEEARARVASGASPLPLIPPFCPGVVALVESRFPSLIPSLGPWRSPVEAAGEEFPLQRVVIVAACPAQFSALRQSSLTERLTVISPAHLAETVLPRFSGPARNAAEDPRISGLSGEPEQGESAGGPAEITASGLRHVLKVLSAAEAGALDGASLLRLHLCDAGCSGSPLIAADPFLSLHRWKAGGHDRGSTRGSAAAVRRQRPYAQRPGVRLDPDMGEAIRKLSQIDALAHSLPGRDCGACGAPSCGTFAEDVVMGRATAAGCPHGEEKR